MKDYAGLREAVRRINEAANRGVRVEGIAREWLDEACTPEVIAALLAERDALMADAERLSAFAYAVMGDWPDVGGLDGFDLQALGEKHGLLEKLERQAPCGEFCQCAEYETGTVECFRLTPMVLAARSKGKEGSE